LELEADTTVTLEAQINPTWQLQQRAPNQYLISDGKEKRTNTWV